MPNISGRVGKTISQSVSLSNFTLYPERSLDPSKDDSAGMECEANEATKRLNIPFDEMVYQDLISLNGIRVKVKSDEFGRLADRPRRIKRLDPEPDLVNFVRPTKQEFLFCDLLGKNFDLEGEEIENYQSCHLTFECDDKDFAPVAESESGKPPACFETISENLDVDTSSIEKFRLLHENYGLDPPQVESHFEGSSLYKRSHSWKFS